MREPIVSRAMIALAMSMIAWGQPADAQEQQKARLRVYLPSRNTQLTIQGVPLKATEKEVRLFESPPLEPNKAYVYDVKAVWTENGKTMTRERSVKVMAGLTTELDLRRDKDDSPSILPPRGGSPADQPTESPETGEPKKTGEPTEKGEPKTSDVKPEGRSSDSDQPKPANPARNKPTPAASDKPASKPAAEEGSSKPSTTPSTEKGSDQSTADLSAPLIATPPEIVEFMLTVAKVRDSDVLFDIGCSDGRISLTAVKKFNVRRAVGIDSNPDRLAAARKAAAGLDGKVEFRRMDISSITESDLAEATVVIVDNTSEKQLADLAPILKKLKVGTRIVTHEFEIPGMRRDDKREKTVDGLDHVIYLYTVR